MHLSCYHQDRGQPLKTTSSPKHLISHVGKDPNLHHVPEPLGGSGEHKYHTPEQIEWMFKQVLGEHHVSPEEHRRNAEEQRKEREVLDDP